jgi:hypothetical protein
VTETLKEHPLTLAHESALRALSSLRALRGSLRSKCPYTTQKERTAWQQGQICAFAACLYGGKNLAPAQSWFGNGEPMEFLGEVGASAHEAVFNAAVAVWKRVETVLTVECRKADGGHVTVRVGGNADHFSAIVTSLWTARSWAELRKNIKIDMQDHRSLSAKLRAEYDSAWRFLATTPDLRKAIVSEMEGRGDSNSTIQPSCQPLPEWVGESFKGKQYSIMKMLWAAGEVAINVMVLKLYQRDTSPNREALKSRVKACNKRLLDNKLRYNIEQRRNDVYILTHC